MVSHLPSNDAGSEHPEAHDFHAVYSAHFDFVWRCLRGLGVADGALDDAAQEVFVTVHRRLETFRGDATLRTWLYAIVRKIAANQRRSERRHGTPAELDPNLPSEARDALAAVAEREALDFIQIFLDGVDAKQRDVFVLSQLEGLSMPEVASILAIPVNTAYTRLRSARLAFERRVAAREEAR